MALPVSEGQREDPMMTLSQISTMVKALWTIVEKLKLKIISNRKNGFC